jgi:inorganic pyrophosphatase
MGDPRFQEVMDVADVARHLKAEIADFFLNYKKLEPRKWVKVKGWEDAKVAENIILLAIQRYKEKCEKQT